MKRLPIVMAVTIMLLAKSAGAESQAKTFYLDEATISDVHAAYKSGALTATQLVQAYLNRIQAYDQAGPKLNVVILLNPKALEEAKALDDQFRKTGKFVGPLHGIPVGETQVERNGALGSVTGFPSIVDHRPSRDSAPS